MKKAMVLLSGGQGSTICLYWALNRYAVVDAVTINYGQTHNREIVSAINIVHTANTTNNYLVNNHDVIDVPSVLLGSSPLINQHEQLEMYPDVGSLPGGLEKTFVPYRNPFFLLIAANRAYDSNCNDLVIGVSKEDFGGYHPDCRQSFIDSFEKMINDAADKQINIITPLINLSKKETVELARSIEGCIEALTWSHTCYAGDYPPCGNCHACLLRQKGFDEAGITDPIFTRSYL